MALAVAFVTGIAAVPSVVFVSSVSASEAQPLSDSPLSAAFALSDAIGGELEERTGRFRASVPLVKMAGRGDTPGVSIAASYDHSLALSGIDRFGLGVGWTLAMPFVDTALEGGRVRVYPATGGVYEADSGSESGLKRFPLKNLQFKHEPQVVPARGDIPERASSFNIFYDDGTRHFFSEKGDLIASMDRFDNRVDYSWDTIDHESGVRLTAVVDPYGQRADLSYDQGMVEVLGPERADENGTRPRVKLIRGEGSLLEKAIDPAGQETIFSYEIFEKKFLLYGVTSVTGAHTSIDYSKVAGGAIAATDVIVRDTGGKVLRHRSLSLNPENNGQRNFTGAPDYTPRGDMDVLFDSTTTKDFKYSTVISDGRINVRSTYNNLHLLQERRVEKIGAGIVNVQEFDYPGEDESGTPPDSDKLPANYALASRFSSKALNPASAEQVVREVETTANYDERGRLESFTDETGTKTTIKYDNGLIGSDHYSLPLEKTVTGKDGTVSVTVNKLTEDKKAIEESTVKAGQPDKGVLLAARSKVHFKVNSNGELVGRTTTWAPDSDVEVPDGPRSVVEEMAITDNLDKHTRTVKTVTAPGPDEKVTSEVTDLSNGSVLSRTDEAGRTTSFTYDAAGRKKTETVKNKDGEDLTTVTDYTSPTSTTVTTPNGHAKTNQTDVLGRTIKISDNVEDGKVKPGATRVIQEIAYLDELPGVHDGPVTQVKDALGRTATSWNDEMDRPAGLLMPSGVMEITRYDDVAHTATRDLIPKGGDRDKPAVTTTTEFDDADRQISTTTSHQDGSPASGTAHEYDGLGRLASETKHDVTIEPRFGPGGIDTGAQVTPRDPAQFPSEPVTADRSRNLLGEPQAKTLTSKQQDGSGTEQRKGTKRGFDAAGRLAWEEDAGGRRTSFTYKAGQLHTRTSPTGTVTTYEYNQHTGAVTGEVRQAKDGRTEERRYDYDGKTGNLTAVWDPADEVGTKVSYDYDADGQRTAIHYPDGTSVTQRFNAAGQVESRTDAAGIRTDYTYTAKAGAPENVIQYAADGKTESAKLGYVYDDRGRVERVERGNGVTTFYTYWDTNQVKTEKTANKEGQTLAEAEYSYDGHGNVERRIDSRPQSFDEQHDAHTDPAADSSTTQAAPEQPQAEAQTEAGPLVTMTTFYRYDAYDRLLTSKLFDGKVTDQDGATKPRKKVDYRLNVSGDVTGITTTTDDGKGNTRTDQVDHEIDAGGRLTALTTNGDKRQQTWDDEGNLGRDHRGNTYTYTVHNQPDSVTDLKGVTTTYRYWADGTRSESKTPATGTAVTFHYTPDGQLTNDSTSAVAEDGTPTGEPVTASYLISTSRAARTLSTDADIDKESIRYLHTDRHGSTTALSEVNGTLVTAYHYDDYGNPTTAQGDRTSPAPPAPGVAAARVNPFTYNNEYTNRETGTQYYKSRIYDPVQNRFTTRDVDPDRHNRFQAFDANPVMKIDPSGRISISDGTAIGFMLASIILSVVSFIAAIPTGGASLVAAGTFLALDIGMSGFSAVVMANYYIPIMNAEATGKVEEVNGIFGYIGIAIGIAAFIGGAGAKVLQKFPGLLKPSTGKVKAPVSAGDSVSKMPEGSAGQNLVIPKAAGAAQKTSKTIPTYRKVVEFLDSNSFQMGYGVVSIAGETTVGKIESNAEMEKYNAEEQSYREEHAAFERAQRAEFAKEDNKRKDPNYNVLLNDR
ncbi:RHS repeat-associated core domain-containing protein [Streptomyces sp. NPDC001817]|uniref:RHS repeat domain-containing protein n=1 Tax=Streptomyces sp. NPDC001817 TaxID=3154398 RepID=UPI00332C3122